MPGQVPSRCATTLAILIGRESSCSNARCYPEQMAAFAGQLLMRQACGELNKLPGLPAIANCSPKCLDLDAVTEEIRFGTSQVCPAISLELSPVHDGAGNGNGLGTRSCSLRYELQALVSAKVVLLTRSITACNQPGVDTLEEFRARHWICSWTEVRWRAGVGCAVPPIRHKAPNGDKDNQGEGRS